ncbi:MAG: zinc transport system substrate-binding protein [Sulfurimonas sp.]|jgi:zinc transport system substrate-binding protein
MKKLRNIIFILIIVVLFLELIISILADKIEVPTKKPAVALSTFSLYDIAKNISQDTLDLVMILPFGVDAHNFEPTPKLMAKILESDLVVYSGAGLEPWTKSFEFKSKVIDMSKFVKLLKPDAHEEHDEHEHGNKEVDPHYWLDIENMITATKLMSKEFTELSPSNADLYKSNSEKYIAMLESIDAKYKKSLSKCEKDTIIVNHNAFSYLSARYGFHVEALSGLSPDAQPSAKSMVKLIEHVREYKLSTVFFESFVSDKAIKSIANEAKVSADVLQPLGNITANEANKDLSYEDIMLINLDKISKAMECK